MGPDEGANQVEQIQKRLDRIEAYLGLSPLASPPPASQQAPAATKMPSRPAETPAAAIPSAPPTTPPTAPPAIGVPPTWRPAAYRDEADADPSTDPDLVTRVRALGIERWIGERWYAVIGAIAVVVGVGLFGKIAVERGWFSFPVIVRCLMGAGFGFALIGVGEWLRRRKNDWAAAGLMAAGLGSIYASTYAAYRLYEPLTGSPGLAFTLLVLVAAFGIALSLHARFSVLGILSLLGGYLVPLLFTDTRSSPLVMPLYLLALLAVGLVVSARAGGGFTYLRTVSSLGTMILGGLWAAFYANDEPWLTLLFVLAAWLGIQFELVVSARRHGLHAGHDGAWGITRRARSMVLCLSITTWAVILGIVVLTVSDLAPDWMAPAGFMAATGLAGLIYAGHLEYLRQMPEDDLERLGVAYLIQSCGCLFVTIALALSGGAEVLAWFALAITGLVTGRRLQVRAFFVTAILSLIITTGRLIVIDSQSALATPFADIYGILPSIWMGLMLFAGLVWVAAGWLTQPQEGERRRVPVLLATIGILMTLGAFIHADAHAGSVAFVWLLIALLVFQVGGFVSRLGLRSIACLVWLLVLFPWTMAYPFHWNDTGWNTWLHPGLVLNLLQTGVAAWFAYAFLRGPSPRPGLVSALISAGVVLVFSGTSLEVARLAEVHFAGMRGEQACVSLWWGAFALALIGAGFRWRRPASRRTGLALMGVAVLKGLIVDLRGVPELWRVASYVGLGLLMLVVALVYSRLSAALEKTDSPDDRRRMNEDETNPIR